MNSHDATSEMKNENIEITCFLVRVFPTPLKFGKRSAGSLLALAPLPSLPLAAYPPGASSRQQPGHLSARVWPGSMASVACSPAGMGTAILWCPDKQELSLLCTFLWHLSPDDFHGSAWEGYLQRTGTGAQTSASLQP